MFEEGDIVLFSRRNNEVNHPSELLTKRPAIVLVANFNKQAELLIQPWDSEYYKLNRAESELILAPINYEGRFKKSYYVKESSGHPFTVREWITVVPGRENEKRLLVYTKWRNELTDEIYGAERCPLYDNVEFDWK